MTASEDLPARYEIRTIGPEHAEWAKAIVMHSNTVSTGWVVVTRLD